MNKFNKGLVPLSGWCDSERYNNPRFNVLQRRSKQKYFLQ